VTRHRTIIVLAAAIALAAGSVFAADVKIGVFDFQRVSEETARGQELRASLEKFGDKKKSEISAKEGELKSMEDKYKAEAFSLTAEKRAQMEKEIQKKQLELQSYRDSAQKEMQIEVNEAQGKFNEQLLSVINALGKERGYTLVFAKEQVAFAADTADMTSELIERFNQETAKPPAAAAAPGAGGAKPADDKKPAAPPAPAPKKP
jgi:outer membrane protein